MPEYPRSLGIALSGGAAHGIAHVGVLKVLERERIPIRMIAASSAGSIAGALFAAGLPAEELAVLVRELRWKDVYRFSPGRMGLLSSEPLAALLGRALPVKRFDRLKIAMKVIATDLASGKAIVISKGDLIPAICASCALPGLLPPAQVSGKMLVDGGVTSGVPTQVLRRAGVDVVMASDVNYKVTSFAAPGNLFEVIVRSVYLMSRQAVSGYIEEADLVVAPEIGDISWQDLERADELMSQGQAAMEAQIPTLKQLLSSSRLLRRVAGQWNRGRK